jgi:hypothetical protein
MEALLWPLVIGSSRTALLLAPLDMVSSVAFDATVRMEEVREA